jgi:hypothetical protein
MDPDIIPAEPADLLSAMETEEGGFIEEEVRVK